MLSNLLGSHGGKRELLGQNFVDFAIFRHDVVVKMSHNARTAIYSWRGLVLGQICDSVAAVSRNLVLVDYVGLYVGVGLFVRRHQKTLKVADQIKNLQGALCRGL